MTCAADLLGRPPVMNHVAPHLNEAPPLPCAARGDGRIAVLVPHVGNSSYVRLPPVAVSLPAPPWGVD